MVSAREVHELLDERPDLEPAIEAVLDADPPWDFHDVDVDSGRFGELVAAGVVEEAGEGYRVTDSATIEQALAGDVPTEPRAESVDLPAVSLPVDRLELSLLAGAIAMVIAFRMVSLPSVYYGGHIVLSGNDPYFYRYLVELLLADPGTQLGDLPTRVSKGEPLFVVTLWFVSVVLGGTKSVAGHVLAWYPVITAAITAGFVYASTVLVTEDRRVALAAVAMLAVLPGHAVRTSFGFADHHPFDYLWLALTVFGLVLVTREAYRENSPFSQRSIAATVAIAIGVTAQTLAWDNSPLIVAVLAPYLGFEALRSVYADDSPLRSLGPVLGALAIATAIVWVVHSRLGWHTELVTSAPMLVLVGGLGVVMAAELLGRLSLSAAAFAGVEIVIVGAVGFVLQALRPDLWSHLIASLQRRLLAPRPIAEVRSIFSETGGWLLLFGFILVIALPYLAWATYRTIDDRRWFPVVVYGWYFLVLAAIQTRFVGQLSPVLAVLAGLAFVHIAERIDIARRPAPFADRESTDLRLPDAGQAGYIVLLFLLIGGLSVVQVPVKTSQLVTSSGLADTAFYLADASEERDLQYPQNYVFSRWDQNRAYNYFVNGESSSYGYARSNFAAFLTSTDPPRWYERLSPRQFVVVTSRAADTDQGQIGSLLYTHHGSQTGSHDGLSRYRLIYVGSNGEYKAFELVPGALLRGQTASNATVSVSTSVEVAGWSGSYRRETAADATGNYSLRVAHPGTYEIDGETVTVTEASVRNGTVVRVGVDDR